MNNIYIFCNGSLGNRLGALIGGLFCSEILNYNPIIVWPRTNWCGCPFNQLFENDIKVLDKNIDDLFSQDLTANFMVHHNFSKYNLVNMYNHSLLNLDLLKNQNKDLYYTHNAIPEFVNEENILRILSTLKIKKQILENFENFSKENNLKNVLGIHFRKTDAQTDTYNSNEDYYYNLIEKSNDRFFICSDDFETENKFKKLNNVISFNKTEYASKLDPNYGWINNVNRTETSVIEAFIDLLILSKTKILSDSISTFLYFAKKYNKLNL